MTRTSVTGTFIGVLLMATALTPARAADMTNERALNPQREPQNWILHHGNYQGHRFSLLKEINADTVKNLKPAFTVALSGFQSGGRYAHGNLEATPIIEDGREVASVLHYSDVRVYPARHVLLAAGQLGQGA